MIPTISEVPPHLGGKDVHLLLRPPVHPRHGRHNHAGRVGGEVLARPGPELLEVRIARPAVEGPDEAAVLDVAEARGGDEGREVVEGDKGAPKDF